jgi:hypothetical protein
VRKLQILGERHATPASNTAEPSFSRLSTVSILSFRTAVIMALQCAQRRVQREADADWREAQFGVAPRPCAKVLSINGPQTRVARASIQAGRLAPAIEVKMGFAPNQLFSPGNLDAPLRERAERFAAAPRGLPAQGSSRPAMTALPCHSHPPPPSSAIRVAKDLRETEFMLYSLASGLAASLLFRRAARGKYRKLDLGRFTHNPERE